MTRQIYVEKSTFQQNNVEKSTKNKPINYNKLKIKMLDIKKIRKQLGLNQEEMGKLLGLSRHTVINYEKGQPIPESKFEMIESILAKEVYKFEQKTGKNVQVTTKSNSFAVHEPTIDYSKKNHSLDELINEVHAFKDILELRQQEIMEYVKIINKLKNLLDKHNIDYSHITE